MLQAKAVAPLPSLPRRPAATIPAVAVNRQIGAAKAYPNNAPLRAAVGSLAANKGCSTDCITAVERHPPTIQAIILELAY